MTDVLEINDANQLDEIRSDWDMLLARTARADFFYTLDWLQVYWRHYGSRQRLRVLVVSEGGQPTGLLPLVVRLQWTKVGPFRVLTFPLDAWGSFYGPIGPDPEGTLSAGLSYIRSGRRDWDLLELRWLDAREGPHDWIGAAMNEAGVPARRRTQDFSPVVELSGTWEQYWASRKGSWRQNCRRNEKKLAKFDQVEHVRYRPRGARAGDDDPRWDLYEQCEQVARRSWQGHSKTGTTLSHESIRPFLRDVHLAAARAGCVDLNLLIVDGQPAAFNYNYHYRGYVSGLRLGFDPQFGRYGVGTVLTRRMLSDCFERGDHTFDFLPGSLRLKRYWQTSLRTSYQYSYYPLHSGRAQALRLKRWLSDRLSPAAAGGQTTPLSRDRK